MIIKDLDEMILACDDVIARATSRDPMIERPTQLEIRLAGWLIKVSFILKKALKYVAPFFVEELEQEIKNAGLK